MKNKKYKKLEGVRESYIFKNRKGITLVALVVTIIILAGITILQLTGNRLFENAKLAKEKTVLAFVS